MISFKLNRLVIAGAALALAGGLLGSGCSDPVPIDYTLEATFCQQVAQADCSAAAVGACYGADASSLQADTTTCVNVRSAPEHCNPNHLGYHPAYAQPCVDAHTAAYASSTFDAGALAAMATACVAVLNNGGTQGTTCTADSDCAATGDSTGFSCILHAGKGTCQVPVQVQNGDSCTNPAAQCVDGYSCDAGGHCVADPGNGQACGGGIACGSGLRCDTVASTCAPLIADNQPCVAASDCAGQICEGTPGASICSHTFTLAQLSPTCSDFK